MSVLQIELHRRKTEREISILGMYWGVNRLRAVLWKGRVRKQEWPERGGKVWYISVGLSLPVVGTKVVDSYVFCREGHGF